jgi:hypothetical protein
MNCGDRTFISIETLPVQAGYWRANELSCADDDEDCLHRCQPAEACVGGTDVTQDCRPGHEGVMCATCINGYYKSSDMLCYQCKEKPDRTFYYLAPIVLLVLFVVIIRCFHGR